MSEESYSDYILSSSRRNKRRREEEDSSEERVKGTESEELNRQINRQVQELQLRGDKKNHLNPVVSGISRIMDLASRTNYAAAEYFDASAESEANKDNEFKSFWEGIKGAGRGLTGHDKTTFHDVIKEHGLPFFRGHPMEEGKPTAAIGFGLDVLLDPATWLSSGTSSVAKESLKVSGKIAAKAAAKKGAEEIVEKGAESIGRTAAERAIKEGLDSSVAAGTQKAQRASSKLYQQTARGRAAGEAVDAAKETFGGKYISKQVRERLDDAFLSGDSEVLQNSKRVGKEVLQGEGIEASKLVDDAFEETTKGQWGLKARGRAIPGLNSQRLYTIGERVNEKFQQNAVGSAIGKGFSTSHLFPGPLKTIKAEATAKAIASETDKLQEINDLVKHMSKSDQAEITHAIERGDLLDQTSSKAFKHAVTDVDEFGNAVRTVRKEKVNLGDIQQRLMKIRDDMTIESVADGTLKQEDLLDNYLYHYYQTNKRDLVNKFKSERALSQNPLKGKTGQVTVKSIEEAKAAGLKPVEEIGDILRLQAHKYYQGKGQSIYARTIGEEFGVKYSKTGAKLLADPLGLVKSDSKYLKGVAEDGTQLYLPAKVHNAVKAMEGLYENKDQTNALLRYFDKGLAAWKFGNTAPNPGHHIRNLVGDMYNNWLDGLDNPLRYGQAIKVLKGDAKTKIKFGNSTLTAPEIVRLYREHGVKTGMTRVEIGARKFGPTQKIMEWSEKREDFGRMAHFIDAMKKEGKDADFTKALDDKGIREVASRAAGRVREYNFDYGDLTDFEKKVMKRIVPFYTWNRKNIPLQLKALAMHPGRAAMLPKSLRLLRDLSGKDPNDGDYPTIGGLQTVPQWLRDIEGIQILGEGQGRKGVYFDPTVALPNLGAFDLIDQPFQQLVTGHPGKAKDEAAQEFVNMTNPVIRNLVESATGRNTFTGGEKKEGFTNEASAQNPWLRLGLKKLHGEDTKWDWINQFAGTSFRNLTEKDTLNEYRRQQDRLDAPLERTGSRAGEMLASMPIQEYKPWVKDEDDAVRASEQLLNELKDLEESGKGLSLLRQRERLMKAQNSERINRILSTYSSDPYYQAFTVAG